MTWSNPFKKKTTGLPVTLQQLDTDSLRKERIRLDNEERRLNKLMTNSQRKRNQTLGEYHTCRENGENHQAKLVARRLKNVDDELRGLDLRHDALNKQQRMTNGLMVLKENENFITRIAGSSQLNNMNIVELQTWVEQATEKGELTMDRLEQMIGTMDSNFEVCSTNQDTSLNDYMAELDNEMPVATTKSNTKLPMADDVIDASLAQVDEKISRLNQS